MNGHRLLTITQLPRPLHPVEAQIVARVTAQDCHIRTCSCGLLLAGRNEVDLYARFKEHLKAVKEVAL